MRDTCGLLLHADGQQVNGDVHYNKVEQLESYPLDHLSATATEASLLTAPLIDVDDIQATTPDLVRSHASGRSRHACHVRQPALLWMHSVMTPVHLFHQSRGGSCSLTIAHVHQVCAPITNASKFVHQSPTQCSITTDVQQECQLRLLVQS